MTDVGFSLDVEDVCYPDSDDALKARTLRRRGRRDVIAALRPHEICYHGNYFGDFPEPANPKGACR